MQGLEKTNTSGELVIVIPAYEPDELLIELINKLNNFYDDYQIVVVDDGSKGQNCQNIFQEAKSLDNVTLLVHDVNKGKGRALKTAFEYIKSLNSNKVIVTADSDGQHKPEDIYRVYNFYKKFNSGLVLGSRKFDGDVPKRSSFGNNVTRDLLRLCNSKYLFDTQTGLRAFGTELLDFMLSVGGDRYEYEIQMLTEAIRMGIDINEIAIQTVYINNNAASHFRPVRDFSRICSRIIKYSLSFFITILVNIAAFIGLTYTFDKVNPPLSGLYICLSAGVFTFIINLLMQATGLAYGNRFIFKNKKKLMLYLFNVLCLLVIDSALCFMIFHLSGNLALAKSLSIIITIILFMLFNYLLPEKKELFEE